MNELNQVSEINELLDQLRDARTVAAELRAAKKQIIDEAQATPTFRALDGATAEADETITALEAEIREMAVGMKEAGVELPDRVEVKKDVTVEITDLQAAVQWSKVNFTPAIKLDEKAFKDAAKRGQIPAELAKVVIGWKAYISTKLGGGNV